MRINFSEFQINDIATEKIQNAIDKDWITEGENTKEFEQLFKDEFGFKYCIATSSGTSACIASLLSLYDDGAKRGDEIITTPCSFVATINAILCAGFIPKFIDIDKDTLNMNTENIWEEITNKTVGIMPVHIMGKPCKMNKLLEIKSDYNIPIIEDCCEAHGARYNNRYVGEIGDMGCFSFFPAHLIICGEGGMVSTNDKKRYEILKSVKSHGRPFSSKFFDFQRIGLNLKMNDLTAGVGIGSIYNFKETFKKRKKNIYYLKNKLKDLKNYIYTIQEEKNETISPHAFPVILKNPKYNLKKFYNYLEVNDIQVKTLFGSIPSQHKGFKFLGYKKGDFPNAEYIGMNGLHFGIHERLNKEHLDYISIVIHEYFKRI